jgi:hypothetical protein
MAECEAQLFAYGGRRVGEAMEGQPDDPRISARQSQKIPLLLALVLTVPTPVRASKFLTMRSTWIFKLSASFMQTTPGALSEL